MKKRFTVCVDSDLHFGCEHFCANNIIKTERKKNNIFPLLHLSNI